MNIFDDISINAGWKAADNHNMSKADFKFSLAAIEASLRERGLVEEGHLQSGLDYLIHGEPIEGTTNPVIVIRKATP